VWPVFIESQRTILTATQFVVDLNQAIEREQDLSILCGRMQVLHQAFEPLVAASDSWYSNMDAQTPSEPEALAARSLRCMSKIKLNRYAKHPHIDRLCH
jgi:hypothetical protein